MFYPPTEYFVAGVRVPADGIVVIRRSMHAAIPDNLSGIIRLARNTMSAAISAENFASRYWQSGGSTNTVLETEQRLTLTQKNELSDAWRSRKSMGPDYAPVMDGGTKARSTGADPTAESAVEARRELVADFGRYFGIPTALLNAPAGDSETYRSNDMANADLLRYTLINYIQGIQDAISDQLPGGRVMEMDTYPLIRASQLLEAQAIDLLTCHKAVLSVEEARDILALPPIEDPTDLLPGQVDAPDLMPEGEPMPMEMPA
jgi:phage portal protein BeeE